jgi:GntR family transcriptional repressor for pyruvate dehydrogenase complex
MAASDNNADFQVIERTDVADATIGTIKTMIVGGELRPGQRLPAERDLAAQLGVSRPSLREAIRALITLNILESRHGEGTFVGELEPEQLARPIDFLLHIDPDSLVSLFEVRRVLEEGAAALASVRATDLELSNLEDFCQKGRRLVRDADSFVEHDIEFHARIHKMARNPILARILVSVAAQAVRSRRQTATSAAVRSHALADHLSIVKVLKSRDSSAARDAMGSHIQRVLDGLKNDR